MHSAITRARADAGFLAFLQILGLELPPEGREGRPLLYYRGRSRVGELSRINRKKPAHKA